MLAATVILAVYATWVTTVFAAATATPVGRRAARILYGAKYHDLSASLWRQVLRAQVICIVTFAAVMAGVAGLAS